MRRTILSVFLLSLCLAARPVAAGVNYWSPIGPDGGTVSFLTAAPSNSRILYAGTPGGVFRSTDGGAHWMRASRGLPPNDILALAVAPSNPSVLYIKTGFGVYASRNGGDTWSQVASKVGGDFFNPSLAVDPRNSRWVWAGSLGGVFWSHDGGVHWNPATADFLGRIWDIAIDPVHPDTLYVASLRESSVGETGIAKSTDGGRTWKRRSSGLDDVRPEENIFDVRTQLTVDPTAPNVVYGCFAVRTADPDAIPQIVTYRSTDGAATWQATQGGGSPLAVDRHGVVYAGNRRSADHGATWQPIALPPNAPKRYLAGEGTLWAGTEIFGIYRSADGAATWQLSSKGLTATRVTSLAVHPDQPGVLYAGSEIGIRKTVDAGVSWQSVDAGLPAEVFSGKYFSPLLALDPQQPQTVYVASPYLTNGFARSNDGGEHWTLLPGDPYGPSSLTVDPTTGVLYLTNVLVANDFCGMARSDDNGLSRRCLLPLGSSPPVFDSTSPGTIWTMTLDDSLNSVLKKSTNRGDSWTLIPTHGLEDAGVRFSLAIDPLHPRVLYMGTSRISGGIFQRLWRSSDGGIHWGPWGADLGPFWIITDLLIDPQDPTILYAAVTKTDPTQDRSGVYWSRDGGRTLQPLRDGLPGEVRKLIQDPTNPRVIYALTLNDGIYTFTRGR
jgi:photosystem II stability/assembly factor-like uncharacterized protein